MPKTLWDLLEEARATVPEVDCDAAQQMLESGEWDILDVREPEEFDSGHIPGAINVPRGYLEVKAEPEHPKHDVRMADRSKKWLLVCSGGHRSLLAGKALQRMGFSELVSLKPGLTGWVNEGRELTK